METGIVALKWPTHADVTSLRNLPEDTVAPLGIEAAIQDLWANRIQPIVMRADTWLPDVNRDYGKVIDPRDEAEMVLFTSCYFLPGIRRLAAACGCPYTFGLMSRTMPFKVWLEVTLYDM